MSFFSKLFGGKSSKSSNSQEIIEETLEGIFRIGEFDLNFDIHEEDDRVVIELDGADEEMLRDRDGQLLDELQFFMKRVLQHNLPDYKSEVVFDSKGFREEASRALIELADRLKQVAIDKQKSVYIRALSPKDRKVIHQHLAGDARVRSKSIGEGLYKKIKIFPSIQERRSQADESSEEMSRSNDN